MTDRPTPYGVAALPIIRVALLGGVVVLGAVALYLTKSGGFQPLDDQIISILRLVFVLLLGSAAVVMFLVRKRRAALSRDEDPTSMIITGWALGEGIALFGGVLLLLSGEMTYFLAGFVMILVSFVFFPIPHD